MRRLKLDSIAANPAFTRIIVILTEKYSKQCKIRRFDGDDYEGCRLLECNVVWLL
jgi:hypothetical protein